MIRPGLLPARLHRLVVLLGALGLSGCDDAGPQGVDPDMAIDAQTPDGATDAARTIDMNPLDARSVDAAVAMDRSVPDLGRLDRGPVDARPVDATVDAAIDATVDAVVDAVPDAVVDAAPPPDMATPDMTVDAASPDAGLLVACPAFDNAVVAGAVADPDVLEASGVAASRRTPGVLWMHNDSGGGNRIFAVGTDGAQLGSVELDGPRPRDWEDLAVGPGPDPALTYLYVADVGDNFEARANVRLRRLPEPALPLDDAPFIVEVDDAESFTLIYPDGAHNCETLLVDPRSGDLFLVVKSADGDSPVYRAAAPLRPDEVVLLEHVADLQFGVDPLPGDRSTTGGDISPSGDEIVIRSYTRAFLWRRAPGASIAEALSTPPCPIPQAGERQGEAIGFGADGAGYFTVSEGLNQPLHHYRRR